MRCPKCSYITFDSGDRCRNCGYEFSFAVDLPSPDLPIQTGEEPEGPLSDFSLADLDKDTGTPAPEAGAPRVPDPVPPRPITTGFDLPLFGDRAPGDDRPLVSAPAVPRPPLSVRKAAPAPRPAPRRTVVETPRLDLTLPEEPQPPEPADVAAPYFERGAPPVTYGETHVPAASGARLLAAGIDLALILAIDAAVLHFTLKLLGLTYADASVIPAAPFLAFLLLLNGGYAAAFTAAGGQTIGKMAARIRVVPADPNAWSDRVPLGHAVLRAGAYLVSALPAGLGFLPAFLGDEKRALHDRLAGTRVIRCESKWPALSERSESKGPALSERSESKG